MRKKLALEEALAMVPDHMHIGAGMGLVGGDECYYEDADKFHRCDEAAPLEIGEKLTLEGKQLECQENTIMRRALPLDVRVATAKTIMFLDDLPSIKHLSSPDLYFAKWCLQMATGRAE